MGDWRHRAACVNHDPSIFCLEGTTKSVRIQQETARSVCLLDCPVRKECLAFAVARRERLGIFGGVNFSNAEERAEALGEV